MIDHSPKQEGAGHYSSSSSQWLRLKDPRIVRVSRAFGGKDRHSKVCTVRGLRDRRVRLSVPTAIQLYDLQERLGLNQPSKVVDWLLSAAKHDIDELPPLPNININIPTANNNFTTTLGGFPSSMMINNNVEDEQQLFNNKGIIHELGEGISSSQKPREQEEEEDIKQGSKNKEGDIANVLGGNNNNSVLLPIRPNHHQPSFLGLLNNGSMPTIGNYQWESSCSDVAELGNKHHIGFTNQQDNHGNTSSSCSNSNNPHHHHQILVCPNPPHHGSTTTQSYFPSSSSSSSHHVTAAMEFMDPIRQINNHYYQMLTSSSTSHNPSFSFAMMMPPSLLHSPSPNTSRESPSHHKHHEFPSK